MREMEGKSFPYILLLENTGGEPFLLTAVGLSATFK
jgi:hypothetical protein